MDIKITLGMLKNISEERMMELKFWEMKEEDFRKLYMALERKNETNRFKSNTEDWEIIDDKVAEKTGLGKDIKIKKFYSLECNGSLQTCYRIANDTDDALIIYRSNGVITDATICKDYWLPDYEMIINGTDPSLRNYLSDFECAEKLGVSTYEYMLLQNCVEEFDRLMKQVSRKKFEHFFGKMQDMNIIEVFHLLENPSSGLKDRCREIGFFQLAYVILNNYNPD